MIIYDRYGIKKKEKEKKIYGACKSGLKLFSPGK